MASFEPMWLAFRTVAQGLSARAGLRVAREAGMRVRDATWFRMVGAARANYSQRVAELLRPLNRRPAPTEVTDIPSKRARGFIAYVDVWVRNRTTGDIYARKQAIRTSTLRSRQAYVDIAVDRYRRAVDRSRVTSALYGTDPDEVVVGGIYSTTHRLTPVP